MFFKQNHKYYLLIIPGVEWNSKTLYDFLSITQSKSGVNIFLSAHKFKYSDSKYYIFVVFIFSYVI